jgi:cytochrome c biogenesis protein CcdA
VLRLLAFVLPLGGDSFAVADRAARLLSSHGLALGARIAERWRELAEKGAGIVLILLGIYLATEQAIS